MQSIGEVIKGIHPRNRSQDVLGSSEIAAIVGLDPRKSPFELAAIKKGLAEQDHNESMDSGKDLEYVVAKIWGRRNRRAVEWLDETVVSEFPATRGWLVATPDFRFHDANPDPEIGFLEGGEVKTLGFYRDGWGDPGTDEIPDRHVIQAQIVMYVCGWKRMNVAAFFSRDEIPTYIVNSDEELTGNLIEAASRFRRDYLLTDRMPEITVPGEIVDSYLKKRFPGDKDLRRKATAEEAELLEKLAEATKAAKVAELVEGSLQARVKELIGDAEGIYTDTLRATWKLAKGFPKTDWEAVEKEAGIPNELIQKHTRMTAGSRRFLLTATGARKTKKEKP